MADADDEIVDAPALDTRFFNMHRRRSTARNAEDVLKQVEKFSAKFQATSGRRKSSRVSIAEVADGTTAPSLSPGGVSEALQALQIPNTTLSSDDEVDDVEPPEQVGILGGFKRGNSVVLAMERFLSTMEGERQERRETLRTASIVLERAPHASEQQLPEEVAAVERQVFAPIDDDGFEDWLNLGDVRRVGDEIFSNNAHFVTSHEVSSSKKVDAVASRFVVGGGFGKRIMDSLARGEFAPQLIFSEIDLTDPETLAGVDKSKESEMNVERTDSGFFPPSRKMSTVEELSQGLPEEFTTFLKAADVSSQNGSAIQQHLGEVIRFLKERLSAAEAPCTPWNLKQMLSLAEELNAALEEGDDADYFLLSDGTAVSPHTAAPLENFFRRNSVPSKSGTESVTTANLVSSRGSPSEINLSSTPQPRRDELDDAVTAYVFTQRRLLPALAEMGKHLYQLEWSARYVIAFLNALYVVDENDAWIREEISGRCVTLEYLAQALQRESLRLEDNILRHDDFAKIKESSEKCKEDLLAPVEHILHRILTECPFRDQRALLKQHQSAITSAVSKATLFFQEFDASWTCFITSHEKWKAEFLDSGFCRLQGVAHAWMTATLGFIDPVLNKQVLDRNTRDASSYKKRISQAEVVRRLVVESGADLNSVAVEVKGVSSRIVGLQLCMASRYLCDQTDERFDKDWHFSMTYCCKSNGTSQAVGSVADQEAPRCPTISPQSIAVNSPSSPGNAKTPLKSDLGATPQT